MMTDGEMKIGERSFGISGDDGVYHDDMPFVVLRVATPDEWIAYNNNAGLSIPSEQLRAAYSGEYFFYEVSVD